MYGRGSSLPTGCGKRAPRSHSCIVASVTTMKWLRSPLPLKRSRRNTSPALKNIAWFGPASARSSPWAAIHTGVAGNAMCATSPTKFSCFQRTSSGAHQNVPSETTGLRYSGVIRA